MDTSLLNIVHDTYKKYYDIWEVISELREGTVALLANKERYCPRRPGETEDIYQLRLAKFSYTPVMSNAIREFTSKLASSPIHFDDSSDYWENFRKSLDSEGLQNEKEFINEVFSVLLYFGRVWCVVDRKSPDTMPITLLDAEELAQPYINIIEPLSVINWGADWFITKEILTVREPLTLPEQVTQWVVYQNDRVQVYQQGAMEADARLVSDNTTGLGTQNFFYLELPVEMWVANSVVLKQKQHTLIENSWADAGSIAGSIQRIFTPQDAPPTDDPRFTYEQPDYSELQGLGNAKVLIGRGFEFKESSGSAIGTLTEQLSTIEKQIKDLVSMRFASVDTSVLAQSGASKEVDMSLLNDAMKAYGGKVLLLYQKLINIVAAMDGITAATVTGLDSYEDDDLGTLISIAVKVDKLPNIPDTAKKVFYTKLSKTLVGSTSPGILASIDTEIESAIISESAPQVNL